MTSLFKKSTNDQAFLKAGFMGFAGSGKTYTATLCAVGLHAELKSKGIPGGDSPVYFLDTETGSDWVRDIFEQEGIELQVAKTRAFTDLVPSLYLAKEQKSILIIDSINRWTVTQ